MTQQIPYCFQRKMRLDVELAHLAQERIVRIEDWKSVRDEQAMYRRLCEINTERRPAGTAA